MAVNKFIKQAYGFGQGLYDLSPQPIVAKRAPTTQDMAAVGTEWCDQTDNSIYFLLSVVANSANWLLVAQKTQTATAASPTATVVINGTGGIATFTGFTTASGAAQAFVITDSLVTASSNISATIQTFGTNLAAMTIRNIVPGAGTFTVNTVNTGAAALNGNVVITFQVLN